jgi:cell division septation protein DedD
VRALFLLLLLANLAFLAWSTWIAPPTPLAGAATPSAPDRGAIRLLRESAPGPALSQPTPAAGESPELAGAQCVSMGPFLERAQVDAAVAQLQRLGFTSRLRSAHDPVRVGHWVRVPDLATPEDAENALAALKAAGLQDAYIVRDDSPGNVISIGVFAEASRAAAAVEAARKAGFAAQTSDRTRTADAFWLDIDRHENGGLPDMDLLGTGRAGSEPPLEMRPCPAIAAPPG